MLAQSSPPIGKRNSTHHADFKDYTNGRVYYEKTRYTGYAASRPTGSRPHDRYNRTYLLTIPTIGRTDMTVLDAPVPKGYTDKHDFTTYAVGFVYEWSEGLNRWLDWNLVVTVKPCQSIRDAYKNRTGCEMRSNCRVFFSDTEYDFWGNLNG